MVYTFFRYVLWDFSADFCICLINIYLMTLVHILKFIFQPLILDSTAKYNYSNLHWKKIVISCNCSRNSFSVNCKLVLNLKFKSVAWISLLICYRVGGTRGLGDMPTSPFLSSKRKKKEAKEKKKVSMQKLLKDSPISKMSLF